MMHLCLLLCGTFMTIFYLNLGGFNITTARKRYVSPTIRLKNLQSFMDDYQVCSTVMLCFIMGLHVVFSPLILTCVKEYVLRNVVTK